MLCGWDVTMCVFVRVYLSLFIYIYTCISRVVAPVYRQHYGRGGVLVGAKLRLKLT